MQDDADAQLKEIATEFKTVAVRLEHIAANRIVASAEGPDAKPRLDTIKSLLHELAYATLLLDGGRMDEAVWAIEALKANCDTLSPREGQSPREEVLDSSEQDMRVLLYSEGGMPWKRIAIEKEYLEKFPELGLIRIRRAIAKVRCETLGLAME